MTLKGASWLCCVILLSSTLIPLTPLRAQIIYTPGSVSMLYACGRDTLYTRDSADAPPVIKQALSSPKYDFVIRTCTDFERNTHYWIRAPRPNRNGICRVYEQEIFPASPTDIAIVEVLYDGIDPNHYVVFSGWSSLPPTQWIARYYRAQSSKVLGLVTDGPCPNGASDRYFNVGHTPDGVIKSFLQIWSKVTQSESAFDRFFAEIAATTDVNGLVVGAPSPRFNQWLRDSVFKNHRAIDAIDCRDLGCIAVIGNIELGFDFGSTGIAITHIRMPPIP